MHFEEGPKQRITVNFLSSYFCFAFETRKRSEENTSCHLHFCSKDQICKRSFVLRVSLIRGEGKGGGGKKTVYVHRDPAVSLFILDTLGRLVLGERGECYEIVTKRQQVASTSSLLTPRASGRFVESFGQPGTRTRIINPRGGD